MTSHQLETPLPGAPEAYLANGLIGLRIPQIPLLGGTALVNGFVGLSPEKRTEESAPAPYPVGADLQLDGVWLSARPDLARFVGQEYDFSCGELRSRLDFAVGAATVRVEVVTVFLTNPAGFLMSLLYGLTGLQLDAGEPQGWAKHPITLPDGWEVIEVERLWARGEPMKLTALHGTDRALLEPTT